MWTEIALLAVLSVSDRQPEAATSAATHPSRAPDVAAEVSADPSMPDEQSPASRQATLEAAREVMTAARFCTLVTLDASGHPQARIMDPFPADESFTVWMGTRRGTRKVSQLAADPRATLSCFDPQGVSYVTLLGRARLVDDPEERRQRFKPEWSDFYDDDFRGDDYLLIRLDPHRLEIISIAHGIASNPKGWKPAVVEFDPPQGQGER